MQEEQLHEEESIELSLLNAEQPPGLGRVKSVQFHPRIDGCLLTAHFTGDVVLWDTTVQQRAIRRFTLSALPIRSALFLLKPTLQQHQEETSWLVAACDDRMIRVVDYETGESIQEWEAHDDFIRDLLIHPTLPYLFSCSDDMFIRVWDIQHQFSLVASWSGHDHYVMQLKVCPNDANLLASASLDARICFWKLDSLNIDSGNREEDTTTEPEFALEGHEKGVNCIEFHPADNVSFLLSGSDDGTVKLWDYQDRVLVHTFRSAQHSGSNINAVRVHDSMPQFVSAFEDGSLVFWNLGNGIKNGTVEKELDLGHGRAWAFDCCTDSSNHRTHLAVGFDNGVAGFEWDEEQGCSTEQWFFVANADCNTHPEFTYQAIAKRILLALLICNFVIFVGVLYVSLWKVMLPLSVLVFPMRNLFRQWQRRAGNKLDTSLHAVSSDSVT